MKKIAALVLALALLCSCTLAMAESHPTPHISTFAGMSTKDHGTWIEITLTQPVDRLFVNWLGKGEKIEELAVTEDLKASVITVGHKYMPGVRFNNAGPWRKDPLSVVSIPCKPNKEPYTPEEIECIWKQFKLLNPVCPKIDEPVWDCVDLNKNGICSAADGDCVICKPGEMYTLYKVATAAFAGPYQVAYITVQGDFIVSYSRNGTIVAIEYNDGKY